MTPIKPEDLAKLLAHHIANSHRMAVESGTYEFKHKHQGACAALQELAGAIGYNLLYGSQQIPFLQACGVLQTTPGPVKLAAHYRCIHHYADGTTTERVRAFTARQAQAFGFAWRTPGVSLSDAQAMCAEWSRLGRYGPEQVYTYEVIPEE